MNKTLAALTAALVAGSALSGSALAQRSDRTERADRADRRADRNDLTSNQIIDRFAARTARIKADLRLTPEQDKHWAGFASAMDDMAKKVADRRTARRDADRTNDTARQNGTRDDARQSEARQGDVKSGDARPGDRPSDARKDDARPADRRDRAASDNFLERMRQDATAMSETAADRKALADAAQPLYDSLDDRQRQRFAESLTNMNRRPDRD
ncbi:MAG: hypothetical protein JWN71_290 [Xanthobacteraceae bacterium]|nr:hypothetical protein [Xanthobacteraceae bacterium]